MFDTLQNDTDSAIQNRNTKYIKVKVQKSLRYLPTPFFSVS